MTDAETFRKPHDTASGRDPKLDTSCSVPDDEKLPDGQHKDHWCLPAEEIAKGYVRPYREKYKHVGIAGPVHALIDLTPEEKKRYDQYGYLKYEAYPEGSSVLGKYWTQAELDKIGKGCGVVTSMPSRCAETYARDPSYYGSTFCCGCGGYFSVREFVWDNSNERVGS